MRKMSLLASLLAFASWASLAGPGGSAARPGDGWIPLFNGKDLAGWHTYFEGRGSDGRADDLVRVEGGVIHVYPGGKDGERRPLGYLATEKAYSFYHLRFEYRWGTRRFAPRARARR